MISKIIINLTDSTVNTLYMSCYLVYGAFNIFDLSIFLLLPLFFILDTTFIFYLHKLKEKYTKSEKLDFKLVSLAISTALSFLFICLIIYHFILYFKS